MNGSKEKWAQVLVEEIIEQEVVRPEEQLQSVVFVAQFQFPVEKVFRFVEKEIEFAP
ncbi:MAG: hypothetical protein ACXVZX_09710 [Terriglobales bacterium]